MAKVSSLSRSITAFYVEWSALNHYYHLMNAIEMVCLCWIFRPPRSKAVEGIVCSGAEGNHETAGRKE